MIMTRQRTRNLGYLLTKLLFNIWSILNLHPKYFIYLFNSRDSAIDPKGICGLGKTKEMNQ
jgi:hypothetical protein